jgi:HPt (histidine-containing phosphotransfer) domain-containing protein
MSKVMSLSVKQDFADDPSEPQQGWIPPEELLEFGDDRMANLVASFIANTDHYLVQIAALLSCAELPGVKAQAHKIKGAAAQMGAPRLTALCGDVEAAALAGSLAEATVAMKLLAHEYAEVCQEMHRFVARIGIPA